MIVIFVAVVLAILSLLAGVHWYVWRRLVRDTTAPGGPARRVGTAVLIALPLTTLATLVGGRAGAPFAFEQVIAWPGYLWLALLLYLTLALLVGEAVRPLLRRALERGDERRTGTAGTPGPAGPAGPVRTGGGQGPAPAASGAAGAVGPAPLPAASGTGTGGAAGAEAGGTAVATAAIPSDSAGTVTASADAHAPGDADTSGATGAGAGTATAVTTEAAEVAARAVGTPPSARARADSTTDTEPGTAADAGGRATAPAHPSRRLFVSRSVAVAASAVALGTVGHGAYGVLRGPRIKDVTVPLAKLPRQAHGYRIAVVSDIHIGPILGRAHTQRIVDTINGAQPDLVAVVGDLVDGSVAELGSAAEPLARLRARHGSYFVTGNHEYISGHAAEWVDFVRELGLRPLENDRAELPGFDLAGVNDVSAEGEGRAGQGPDFGLALGDRDRSRAAVLLAHQPVVIHDAVKHGVDLQLSGHTHGGQLWPGPYLAEFANPTVAGLERYGDTQLYVSRGAGAWGPPVRVGADSDITIVQLASKRT